MSTNILTIMKNKLNYTTEIKNCKSCVYFKEDMSTDNFGSGDRCTRNLDANFSVQSTAICDGHKPLNN